MAEVENNKPPEPTINNKPEEKAKPSILDRASQKVDEQLGINKKIDPEKIKSPVARKRLQKLRRTRRIMIWSRRIVVILLILAVIFIFWRFSTHTFDNPLAGYSAGEKVLIDRLYSNISWFTDNLKITDEIIFYTREDKSAVSVGRIAGKSGAKIAFGLDDNGFLLFKIDGKIRPDLSEPNLSSLMIYPATVPDNSFFLLEDKIDLLEVAEINLVFINESEAYLKINDKTRTDLPAVQGAKLLETLGLKKGASFKMHNFSTSGLDSRNFGFVSYNNVYAKIIMQWNSAE